METLKTILIGLMSFGLLITVHEIGHFVVAKKSGIRVSEFSIGFGPTVVSKNINGVLCKISCLPLGGYVKMPETGTDDGSEGVEFSRASPLKKIATLLAGSTFNLIFGYILLLIVFLNLPSEAIGFSAGAKGIMDAVIMCSSFFIEILKILLVFLKEALFGMHGFETLAGPVGITNIISESYKVSFLSYIMVLAILSINIGLFNLLPIPALDGSRALFILIEAILRKKISLKLQEKFHFAGMLALMALFLTVTIKDVWAIVSKYL